MKLSERIQLAFAWGYRAGYTKAMGTNVYDYDTEFVRFEAEVRSINAAEKPAEPPKKRKRVYKPKVIGFVDEL